MTKDAARGMRPRQGYWHAVVLGLHSPWPVEQQGWVWCVAQWILCCSSEELCLGVSNAMLELTRLVLVAHVRDLA